MNLRLNSTAPQPPSHHSGCQDELTVYSRQVKLLDNFLRAVKYHEFPNIPQLRNYTSLTNQILRVACSGPLFRVRFYFVTVCVCLLHQKKEKEESSLQNFKNDPKLPGCLKMCAKIILTRKSAPFRHSCTSKPEKTAKLPLCTPARRPHFPWPWTYIDPSKPPKKGEALFIEKLFRSQSTPHFARPIVFFSSVLA